MNAKPLIEKLVYLFVIVLALTAVALVLAAPQFAADNNAVYQGF
jgi:hypothetical protein